MQTQTDNHNPRAKLALRRELLRRYHSTGELHVFDAFQGEGTLWSALRTEFPCASYWGVDIKPKPGRLKCDSLRILSQPGLQANVIDLDAYGSPWKHWLAILANHRAPVTVFLTMGMIRMGGGGVVDKLTHAALGLHRLRIAPPPAVVAAIQPWACCWMLGQPSAHGLRIRAAIEAPNPGGNAQYFGVRLDFTPKNLRRSL